MKEEMSHYNIDTVDDLVTAIRNEWNNISLTTIQRLYLTYRNRLRCVIAADGNITRY